MSETKRRRTEDPSASAEGSGAVASGEPRARASASSSSGAISAERATPVFGVGLAVGLLGFVSVMLKLPLAGDPGFLDRLGLAAGIVVVAFAIYNGARKLITSVLKAMVELVAVGVFLFDVAVGALLIWWRPAIEVWAADVELGANGFLKVAAGVALALFVVNAVAFLLLYPLSRVVGTELEIT